ncbi:MAG TPA: HAD-IA family hydrolase [Candidatus Saccharimonadales bacterium]|nr:HAD-IA family hydrolase [Candidatus Saccharimonadales bacterium]
MSEIKAALFDADGVIIMPQKLFSRQYAEKHNLDPDSFEAFFRGDFSDAITGRADLKDLIRQHHDIWRWEGDPQELLDMWFAAENQTDSEVLEIIKQQRAAGLPVYLATNQEKYRAKYLREVMLPDLFDGMFISSEIGCMKRDPQYWVAVLSKLAIDIPGIKASQVVFFDDSKDSVDGAVNAGITAYLYEDAEQVRQVLG